MHSHLAGDMTEYYVAILQFDAERRVREAFQDLPLHLDDVVFSHTLSVPI